MRVVFMSRFWDAAEPETRREAWTLTRQVGPVEARDVSRPDMDRGILCFLRTGRREKVGQPWSTQSLGNHNSLH